MAITTEENRTAELTTDGVVEDFDFDMVIHGDDWLEVYFKATGGSYELLTLNTDYSVVFTEYGGTVSTDGYTAPLVAGELLIIRHPPGEMQTNWFYNDNHSGQQHQDDFDHSATRYLYLLELIQRALRFAVHSSTKNIILPEPEANLLLGWTGGADGIENKTPDALGLTAALSDLTDVDISDPSDGDMIQYDGSAWKKVTSIAIDSAELLKSGNNPGDNGNCRFKVSGNLLIIEARVGGAWVATGWEHTIA